MLNRSRVYHTTIGSQAARMNRTAPVWPRGRASTRRRCWRQGRGMRGCEGNPDICTQGLASPRIVYCTSSVNLRRALQIVLRPAPEFAECVFVAIGRDDLLSRRIHKYGCAFQTTIPILPEVFSGYVPLAQEVGAHTGIENAPAVLHDIVKVILGQATLSHAYRSMTAVLAQGFVSFPFRL